MHLPPCRWRRGKQRIGNGSLNRIEGSRTAHEKTEAFWSGQSDEYHWCYKNLPMVLPIYVRNLFKFTYSATYCLLVSDISSYILLKFAHIQYDKISLNRKLPCLATIHFKPVTSYIHIKQKNISLFLII